MAQYSLMRKLTAIFVALALPALLISSCGTPDRAAQESAAPAAAAPTAPPPQVTPAPSDRLYISDNDGSGARRLAILSRGTRLRDLPFGVVSPDWATLYTAQDSYANGQHKTRVQAIDLETGQPIRETTIDGAYALPTVGLDGTPGGLSPNGDWLVLQAAPTVKAGHSQSQLAILDTAFKQPPKQVNLDGDFWFDAINNNGYRLYLLEYLPAGARDKYQVRLYYPSRGTLDPDIVTPKGESIIMRGVRQAEAASPNGDWLYSLYLNQGYGPFVHALMLDQPFAFCIDLPKTGKDDEDKQLLWSLALSKDGGTLYAANGALGLVAEIDTNNLQVRRSATLPAPTASAGPFGGLAELFAAPVAQAKRALVGGSALSPDGKTLFTLGEQGLLVINTGDLKLSGRYLPAVTLNSVALSADGARLYVVSGDEGKIIQLDPATGATVTEVAGAQHPSGVLRVEARK
ncbi:MAG TPA: hypothetical protein VF897_22090 [Roseiflexaceae bacterium]